MQEAAITVPHKPVSYKPRLLSVGDKIGFWTVQSFHSTDKNGNNKWLCLCICGVERPVATGRLRRGGSSSCGCRGLGRKPQSQAKSPNLHQRWANMRSRVYNPRNRFFANYGARGITVCPEWQSFKQFKADMGEPPSHHHTLDRIDVNGPYCKENCRWAYKDFDGVDVQQNNRANNVTLTLNGATKSMAVWASELGINRSTLWYHVHRGLTLEAYCKKSGRLPRSQQSVTWVQAELFAL